MPKILDYHCSYDTEAPEPMAVEAYTERNVMAQQAKTLRERSGTSFCVLPFCHTLEAEALSAKVTMSGISGPRVRSFHFHTLEELEQCSMDFTAPRLQETIAACHILQEQGEEVLFQITGPLTILGNLLPPEQLFRAIKKQPEQVLDHIFRLSEELKRLIFLLEREGITLFSYADPSGGVNLVGSKWAEEVAQRVSVHFLKDLDTNLKPQTLLFLCPKTAFVLLGSGLAVWEEHQLAQQLPYREAAVSLRGTIRFAGQSCINRLEQRFDNIKELKLREVSGC